MTKEAFAIWRHENALGNSAEHTYGLCLHLYKNNIKDPTIYVETEFQECFAIMHTQSNKTEYPLLY